MKKQHPLDKITDKLTESIIQTIDHLPSAEIPFGSVQLSKEEQIEQYLSIRDNPEEWVKLLSTHGLRDTMRYARDMEQALKGEVPEVEDGGDTDQQGE